MALNTARPSAFLARWIFGSKTAAAKLRGAREIRTAAIEGGKSHHWKPAVSASPWSESRAALAAAPGEQYLIFWGAYVRQSLSRGWRAAKKGHYSQPGMDEPSLTHALGKHCSLCSAILFHIPLVLITFSFSIYSTD